MSQKIRASKARQRYDRGVEKGKSRRKRRELWYRGIMTKSRETAAWERKGHQE